MTKQCQKLKSLLGSLNKKVNLEKIKLSEPNTKLGL